MAPKGFVLAIPSLSAHGYPETSGRVERVSASPCVGIGIWGQVVTNIGAFTKVL